MRSVTFGTVVLLCAAAVALPAGQSPDQALPPVSAAQRSFEAGQYDQALAAIATAREQQVAGPQDVFLAAQAQLRRVQNDLAKAEFSRLIGSGDETWRLVGESSNALIDNNLDRALELATQAVTHINDRTAQASEPPTPAAKLADFPAFYQMGLVKVRRDDWAGAAEAFEKASQLNPTFAYAHYYAGLAYSRVKRPDRVAVHFEQFLKLAPNAPERAAVMSIMRTLRGA